MPRPVKGTPEYNLWIAAIDVATSPPRRNASNTFATKVPWSRIERLRKALEGVGIDWNSVKESDEGV